MTETKELSKHAQDCRPTQGWNELQDIAKQGIK